MLDSVMPGAHVRTVTAHVGPSRSAQGPHHVRVSSPVCKPVQLQDVQLEGLFCDKRHKSINE